MSKQKFTALALAALLLAGCGGDSSLKRERDALKADLAETEKTLDETQADLKETKEELEETQADLEKAPTDADVASARQDAESQRDEAQKQRDAALEAQAEAEEEQERLEEAVGETTAQINRARARAARTGLAVTDELTDPTVTPKYNGIASVVTSPSVTFETKQGSRSGRWHVSKLSNTASDFRDDLVVYTDLGPPTRKPITEVHSIRFTVAEGSNTVEDAITDADRLLIKSSSFPTVVQGTGNGKVFPLTRSSTPDDPNGANDLTARIRGSFQGASGHFHCTSTSADGCAIRYDGTGYIPTGTWTFTTSKSSTVLVDDESYLYFGAWEREARSPDALTYSAFSGGMHPATGTGFTGLTGSATYTGPAIGHYAIQQEFGEVSSSGAFTASARIEADFGAVDANGSISGRITKFSNDDSWSLTLNRIMLDDGPGVFSNGTVNWRVGDDVATAGGSWSGGFFSDDTYVAQEPEGVSGEFQAVYGEIGAIRGAFGARKQ